jgi:hypothetical protein
MTKKSARQLDAEIAEALSSTRAQPVTLEDVAKRLSDEIRAIPVGPARTSPEAEWLYLAWRVVRVAQGHERAQRGSSRAIAKRLAAQIANGEPVPIEILSDVVQSPSERAFRKKMVSNAP